MAEDQQFCLRWNNFQMNITSQFEALRDEEDFVDVTLACEGQRLKAHKVVLSACSPYFKELFKSNPCKHPILFMRDVEFRHLRSLVEFMYAGEVNVAQAQLSAFLRTAESLQIRGLTEAPRHSRFDGHSHNSSDSSHSHRASKNGPPTSPDVGAAEDDDVLSLSPSASPSPPSKRQCTGPDASNIKREIPDLVEPKLEAPDYSSDGESKADSVGGAVFLGLDSQMEIKASFSGGGLQGGLEMLPGTSTAHNFLTDVSATQDPSSQDEPRKIRWEDPRPCPLCQRVYSNNSNLRRHMKIVHGPPRPGTRAYYKGGVCAVRDARCCSFKETPCLSGTQRLWTPPPLLRWKGSSCDFSPGHSASSIPELREGRDMVPLAPGIFVPATLLQRINRADYRKMTRGLATALFSPLELGSSSVTGQRWTRAAYCSSRPTKPALDRRRVEAILAYVGMHFPEVERSKVKQVLAYKCKESAAQLRVRGAKLLESSDILDQ